MSKSENLYSAARELIPGGVNSPVRAFTGVGGTPLFIERADGAYLYDVDGKAYIDYVGSWGPMVLGHNHPAIRNAVIEAAQRGLSFGAPTEMEVKMAALVTELVPTMDMVRMVNSGTEATMSAIRLARGFTGRDKIIKFEGCYHGHADCLLVKAGSGALTLGQPFNSLLQLEIEQGKPRNPFINAGALVVCDMLQSRLSAPRQRMLEIVRQLSGVDDIAYDPVVARSEFEHSARNAAIAWLMKSFGNFHNDVATVLQNYFHYCALKMSCVELAQTFLFLAHQGHAPHLDQEVVSPLQARQVNALMATSGMYQNAGEFAWRVGLPAKSGVGGGVVAIVPHEMAIAVWSPELDETGNSLAGVAILEKLTQRLGRSVY